MKYEYRIRRLYRNATGWCWWLQWGYWSEATDTAMAYATGKTKMMFRVAIETPYRTKALAAAALRESKP